MLNIKQGISFYTKIDMMKVDKFMFYHVEKSKIEIKIISNQIIPCTLLDQNKTTSTVQNPLKRKQNLYYDLCV